MNFQTIYKQQKNIYRNIKRGGFLFSFNKNNDAADELNAPAADELNAPAADKQTELDLSYSGENLEKKITNLEDYKNLQTLYLSGIFINKSNMEMLSTKIEHLTNLKTLNLYNISRFGDTNPYINILLCKLPKSLKILNLGRNEIKNNLELFKIISKLESLEILNLSHNSINKDGVEELEIIKALNLKNLDLSGNKEITNESIPVILKHLPESLEILNLSSTGIEEDGIEKILTILKDNDDTKPNLKLTKVILNDLDINNENIRDEKIEKLNQYLKRRQKFIS